MLTLYVQAKFESLPKDVLIAERIWPLPEYIRHNLIEKYCPKDKEGAHSNAANADCLARVSGFFPPAVLEMRSRPQLQWRSRRCETGEDTC